MRGSTTLRSPSAGLFGLFAFVLAVLVFPLRHAVHHELDHEHGPAGAAPLGLGAHHHEHAHPHGHPHPHERGHEQPHEHPHDDGKPLDDEHHDHEPNAERGDESSEEAPHHHDPGHGHGSLEHFGLAALTVTQLPVPNAHLAGIDRSRAREAVAPSIARRFNVARPRGPPV